MTIYLKLKNKKCSLYCTSLALRGWYRTLMLIETCEHWNRLFVREWVSVSVCECGCVFEYSEANINFVQSTLLFLNYDAQMSAELMYLSAIPLWTSNSLQKHICLIPSSPTSSVIKGQLLVRDSDGNWWGQLMLCIDELLEPKHELKGEWMMDIQYIHQKHNAEQMMSCFVLTGCIKKQLLVNTLAKTTL